jgi:ATP-dependent Lhr-like helicase
VACGLATSDGFAGLRALVRAASGRPIFRDRGTAFAGRWTAVAFEPPLARDEAVRIQAASLLRRYGIVCRRLLIRETNAAPWRELVRVYRRLEARGEIRGGRFVHGVSGEQFALPEAVERLREVRRSAPDSDDDDQRRRSAEPGRHHHRRRSRPCGRAQPHRLS